MPAPLPTLQAQHNAPGTDWWWCHCPLLLGLEAQNTAAKRSKGARVGTQHWNSSCYAELPIAVWSSILQSLCHMAGFPWCPNKCLASPLGTATHSLRTAALACQAPVLGARLTTCNLFYPFQSIRCWAAWFTPSLAERGERKTKWDNHPKQIPPIHVGKSHSNMDKWKRIFKYSWAHNICKFNIYGFHNLQMLNNPLPGPSKSNWSWAMIESGGYSEVVTVRSLRMAI